MASYFGDNGFDWNAFGSDALGGLQSAAASGLGSAISGGISAIFGSSAAADQYHYAKKLMAYQADLTKELARFNQQIGFENADYSKKLRDFSVVETPGLQRAGLVAAGYNPILAVNSAGGQPFSQSVNSPAGAAGSANGASRQVDLRSVDILDGMERLAQIKQTNAQTDLIQKKTLGEGWTIKTLSAGEAQGLGASLLGKLGFHFNGSEHQTFLVAYNPITGELRNLGNAKVGSFSTSGEVTNAADVPHIDIEHSTGEKYRVTNKDWSNMHL